MIRRDLSAERDTPHPRAIANPLRDFRRLALVLSGLTVAVVLAAFGRGADADTLRLMLRPQAAARGTLPAELRTRVENAVGAPLEISGITRTGAIEFALPDSARAQSLTATLRKLRRDPAILWVEAAGDRELAAKSLHTGAPGERGAKILVRLASDATADWTSLLARFSDRIGVALVRERRIGQTWVLRLAQAQSSETLARMAGTIAADPAVRYADPAIRLSAHAAPDDPLFGQQWNLTDPRSGINFMTSPAMETGFAEADVVVGVIDTGIVPHPDLDYRVLDGYDFISDVDAARDGDGVDPDARDEGTWNDDGECGGESAHASTWHGLFVAGQIAAYTNNTTGIAGVAGNAWIMPVRALGKCNSGSLDDMIAALQWVAGIDIGIAPVNTLPARVINMSLGGPGACAAALQDAVDAAIANGAIIVASAGNDTADVVSTMPANCSGVIAVGAHNRRGDRAVYSNFGNRIDVSAPAGDGTSQSESTLSLTNVGTTVPGDPDYAYAAGTSFAAPLVTGTIANMVGRDPTLTSSRALDILQSTARPFALNTTCGFAGICGSGMLDSKAAIVATVPHVPTPPFGAATVVEYYDPGLDHYMLTADPAEMAFLDQNPSDSGSRSGFTFYAWTDPMIAPAEAKPVCRFIGTAPQLKDSRIYTADPAECTFLVQQQGTMWSLESGAAFYVNVPDSSGNCAAGTIPVFRYFNDRRDANQRYTNDITQKSDMVGRGWVPDGNGPNGVNFCAPS